MDKRIDFAPCGFLIISKDGVIKDVNNTLLEILEYELADVIHKHIYSILSKSSHMFYQLYFLPLVAVKHHVEEMYLSFASRTGKEIPVLMNASMEKTGEDGILCVILPMGKRNEYENQLLLAKKLAEEALAEKNTLNNELEAALHILKAKQEELLEVNEENEKFRLEMEEDLNLAKKVQETSLTEPISNEQVEIVTYYKASSELSGDIYGFYEINKNQYGAILLDVMGHGISSALITMSLQSLFQRLISRGFSSDMVMKELDNHLHRLFLNDDDAWHYCTAIYLYIDTSNQTIEYINAGHPAAIFQDGNGQRLELSTTTPPLGTFTDIHFKGKKLTYNKGGRILLYTDGVSDPLGSDLLNALVTDYSTSPLNLLKEKILESLETVEDRFNNDDKCFILIDLK